MFEMVAKHTSAFELSSKQGTAGTISRFIEDVQQQELPYTVSKGVNQCDHFEGEMNCV
jgi:hypothetical protein